MRYLEKTDKDGNPIFENDTLILTIKDKFWGNAYFGKFCEFHDIDKVIIHIIENKPFLEISYEITYFKNDKRAITNQEEQYYNYRSHCLEHKLPVEINIEDFSVVENANDFYISKYTNQLFFSYIVSKGVIKENKTNYDAILTDEKDFLIRNDFGLDLYIGDTLIVELNDFFIEQGKKLLTERNIEYNPFTHVKFCFSKKENQFIYKIKAYYTNSNGTCTVFDKNNTEYEIFLGIDDEMSFLNILNRYKLPIKKIN